MALKNGFLLCELIVGLTLLLFLIFFSTYYIVQLKNIQWAYINRLDAFLIARNTAEKLYARNSAPEIDGTLKNNKTDFTLTINKSEVKIEGAIDPSDKLTVSTITVHWKERQRKNHLVFYSVTLEDRYE
jgi:hypothetical protein